MSSVSDHSSSSQSGSDGGSESLSLQDLLDIYYRSSQLVMTFWTVFITAGVFVTGLVLSKNVIYGFQEKIMFSVMFGVFAVSNLYPLVNAQKSSIFAAQKLKDSSKIAGIVASPLWGVILCHVIFTSIVLLIIVLYGDASVDLGSGQVPG